MNAYLILGLGLSAPERAALHCALPQLYFSEQLDSLLCAEGWEKLKSSGDWRVGAHWRKPDAGGWRRFSHHCTRSHEMYYCSAAFTASGRLRGRLEGHIDCVRVNCAAMNGGLHSNPRELFAALKSLAQLP